MRGTAGSSSSLRLPAEKEKQRRDRMKDLYSTLATLLHLHQPYESMSLPKFLDQATSSVEELKKRVERLKGMKEALEKEVAWSTKEQMVQVREVDLKLEANLIINRKSVIKPFQVLKVIEEGGAQIMTSTFTLVGNYMYCIIHAQAFQARLGFDAEIIESRLMELVYQQ